jgi:hypothetical protein
MNGDMGWYLTPERIEKMHRDEAESRKAAFWLVAGPSLVGGLIGATIAIIDIIRHGA